MKIHFIGTSHGAPEKNRGCTAMLLETEGNYYVIDAGSSIEKYMIDNDLDVEAINAIFITHMHEDHMGTLTRHIEGSSNIPRNRNCQNIPARTAGNRRAPRLAECNTFDKLA